MPIYDWHASKADRILGKNFLFGEEAAEYVKRIKNAGIEITDNPMNVGIKWRKRMTLEEAEQLAKKIQGKYSRERAMNDAAALRKMLVERFRIEDPSKMSLWDCWKRLKELPREGSMPAPRSRVEFLESALEKNNLRPLTPIFFEVSGINLELAEKHVQTLKDPRRKRAALDTIAQLKKYIPKTEWGKYHSVHWGE